MLRGLLLTLFILGFSKLSDSQHLHDLEVTTQPSWAPTGRLNQFNGFATPRPSLLPQNAQMVYASVWAAWSAWSFCSDSKRIRVRACNTVRGFRCLGPNQETEPCDPATSPILGRPPRPNAVFTDYDTVDPWQEDRFEALKQLYPDDSIDEKLNRLPEHEKSRMLAGLAPPTPLSHELLQRPLNGRDGAPGATPERMFGARALGAKAFAVKASEQPVKLEEFADISDDKVIGDKISDKPNDKRNKSRGEGTFSKGQGQAQAHEGRGQDQLQNLGHGQGQGGHGQARGQDLGQDQLQNLGQNPMEIEEVESEMSKLKMDGPKFTDKEFKEDIFGSIEELMNPITTVPTVPPTTTVTTTTTTTKKPTTTTTMTTTTVTTTTVPPTTRRPPSRVTPRLLTVPSEDSVELVTPSMQILKSSNLETIDFFEDMEEATTTSRKPWKNAIHYGEVIPSTTKPPPTTTTTPSGFPIPEEISLDTLHALDWMLANMTKAAEESQLEGNELRRRLDSAPNDPTQPTKTFAKKPRHPKKKNRVKTHRTKIIQLHYGEVEPAMSADRKFPKFRTRNAHRAKIFGIKTSSVPENQLKIGQKKEELVDEINDLKDLMEQLDERIESRSALMEDTFDGLLNTKHEHDSPYRQV